MWNLQMMRSFVISNCLSCGLWTVSQSCVTVEVEDVLQSEYFLFRLWRLLGKFSFSY